MSTIGPVLLGVPRMHQLRLGEDLLEAPEVGDLDGDPEAMSAMRRENKRSALEHGTSAMLGHQHLRQGDDFALRPHGHGGGLRAAHGMKPPLVVAKPLLVPHLRLDLQLPRRCFALLNASCN